MRDHGIPARHQRRDQVTTDSRPGLPVAENRLDRNFTPTAPNPVWMSDIPSLWTDEGGFSLAIVRDLFNREGGLVAEAAQDDRPRDGCADPGLVQEAAGTGADTPLRPGESVRPPCVSGA